MSSFAVTNLLAPVAGFVIPFSGLASEPLTLAVWGGALVLVSVSLRALLTPRQNADEQQASVPVVRTRTERVAARIARTVEG